MKCDIVVPTYNSAATITQTLEALWSQVLLPGWSLRIIVSDDGSSDETLSIVENLPVPSPWELQAVIGSHAGPGGARNRALPHLTAEITFFLGADIFLRPGSLAQHLIFHEQNPAPTAAALGLVRWDPRLSPTPFMEWMTHGGQQNDFDTLLGRTVADPAHFFYGSHLSLKRQLLGRAQFPDALPGYGWEDLALGRELKKQGLTLHILPAAVALHHHFYSASAIAKRQQAVGQSFVAYQKLYPDVAQDFQRSWGNHLRRALWVLLGGQALLYAWITMFQSHRSFPRLFLVFTSNEFWRGMWRSYGGFTAFLSHNNTFYSKRG